MPKYIKLFESFIDEAAPYAFDPTKTALPGATILGDNMYYSILKLGRIYVATKDSESVKNAPGNVSVTLDANNPTLQKQLVALGGKLDAKASGEFKEPSGGVYKHLAKIHFNLTDAETGEPLLKKIVDLLNGVTASSSGTSGTAGTSGKTDAPLSLADQIFGKDLAAKFREDIAKSTGKPYDANTSIKAQLQPKITQADADLKSKNPEYFKLSQDIVARAKQLKLDPATGKDAKGVVDKTFADLKNKMEDMLAKAVKL